MDKDIKDVLAKSLRMAWRATGLPTLADPESIAGIMHIRKDKASLFMIGTVTRTGCGAYDCEVTVGKSSEFLCNVAVPSVSNTFGYSLCAPPIEGSRVLIVAESEVSKVGFIVGILPPYDGTVPEGYATSENPLRARRNAPDSKVGHEFTAAYKTPAEDPKYANTLNANALRPVDIIPGELALVNENDCGVVCSMFSASITSGLAYLKASRFDDTVRIVCRTFQQYTTAGLIHTFNDCGYITTEEKMSIYQGERLGIPTMTGSPFEANEGSEENGTFYLQNKTSRQTSRERIKSFLGFLGGLVSKFILRPENSEVRSMDDNPKDSGLAQMNVDGAGRVSIRSAGGISLQRYDSIPVPFRKREYWDPDGTTEPKFKPIEPFVWDDDTRVSPVQLTDSLAWEYGQYYKRFDSLSGDFYTPQEKELPSLSNQWDPIDKSESADLSKNIHKRCGLFLQPDGGVIIRDTWGSEIIMSGGDITITAKGDIKVISPKTVATLGKNIAMDADVGIDISADNLSLYSGGNAHLAANGVLIESLSSGEYGWEDEKKGSDTYSTGITLQAPNTGVAIRAGRLNATVDYDAVFVSGTLTTDVDALWLCGKDRNLVSEGAISEYASGNHIVQCDAHIMTCESFVVFKGGDVMTPLWVQTDDAADKVDVEALSAGLTSDEVKTPYTKENLDKWLFTFRSSAQADTADMVFMKPTWKKTEWSLDTAGNEQEYRTWRPFLVDAEDEFSQSWPGFDTLEDKRFNYTKELNIEAGVSKSRDELVDKIKIEKEKTTTLPRA